MILKRKKVILRPIKLSDAPRFVKWLNESTVNKFVTKRAITLKEELKWIRSLAKIRKIEHHFAIDTKEGIHIGSTALFLKPQNKMATFGILIGDKRYWNKGYGTDATKTILAYGFNKLKLHRIQLEVYQYNPRAIRVYKKLGFKLEGIRRQANFYRGKFHDDLLMGILKSEWQKLNKNGKTF